ncbi:hypothetical protein I4U23_010811 [Adineta vaga]|nr:hypothetical protein I4U23_010811 [Adineta vaga]
MSLGIITVIMLSCIQDKEQNIEIELSRSLSMNEAYLIVRNVNYSNNNTLFGNKIVCEYFDLEEIIEVSPNTNYALIIDTKYAYDWELHSSTSNRTLLRQFTSYTNSMNILLLQIKNHY